MLEWLCLYLVGWTLFGLAKAIGALVNRDWRTPKQQAAARITERDFWEEFYRGEWRDAHYD